MPLRERQEIQEVLLGKIHPLAITIRSKTMDTKKFKKMLESEMPDELKVLETPTPDESEVSEESGGPHATRGFNRKNWMRNKPCPCGSKTKFKKCCWGLYTK